MASGFIICRTKVLTLRHPAASASRKRFSYFLLGRLRFIQISDMTLMGLYVS